MAHLFVPDQKKLCACGYNAIAHVPVIFDNEHIYCREYNWFLRERALGEWAPQKSSNDEYGHTVSIPRLRTLIDLAYKLKNWIEWCNAREVDWRQAEYVRHLLAWRDDMASGVWSEDGSQLKSGTCEGRVDAAIQFLKWAAERGLRLRFDVPLGSTTFVYRTKVGRKVKLQRSRRGNRKRPDPASLRLPTPDEIRTWLATIKLRCGFSKWLACRFIIGSGVRLDEAASLKAAHVPDRKDWHIIGRQVVMTICDGTKGGRPRSLSIPLPLAILLDEYKNGRRMTAIAKGKKLARNRPAAEELFLSDFDGRPLSRQTIYRAWTTCGPFLGWSPHLGRHAWACLTLIDHIQEQATSTGINGLPKAVFYEVGRTAIDTIIRPQLGHVSSDTTAMYLRWALQTALGASEYTTWQEALDQDEVTN